MESTQIDNNKISALYINATITAIADITPHLRRFTFAHDYLKQLEPVRPGAHLKIFIPKNESAAHILPEMLNGKPVWPEHQEKPYMRTYTIRQLNTEMGTIIVEFVLHGDSGPASAWAERAKVGDLLGLGIRTGKKATTADWYLFAGDETALPAIAAQMESLPAHAKGVALLEVDSEEDCFELSAPVGVTVSWLFRRGIAPAASDLLLRQLSETAIPAAPLSRYIWVAGESAMINQIRTYAKTQLDLAHGELHATVYWSAGISEDELGKSR